VVSISPRLGLEILPGRILCFTAHPDDETVFVGGTLALLAERGATVHLVCATRGEGGETGEPPVCSRGELGAVRESELRCAAQILGCASVDFLPFHDPPVGPDGSLYPFASSAGEVARLLEKILSERKADVVITHGSSGEYGHPAHVLAHRACLLAALSLGVSALYTFSADYHEHPRKRAANRDDPADFVVDIEPVFEKKLAAMECHLSQRALFVRRASAEAGRPVPLREVVLRRESFHRLLPGRP
jgi:LmbE family N-acetylglucosaminyl deacetylase